MKKKKLTYKEIAEKTGLGIGTISRYFNDYGISQDAKEKIKNVVIEMGYIPNFAASTLKKGSKDIYVLLPFEINETSNLNFVHGLKESTKDKYNILVSISSYDPKEYLESLKNIVSRNPKHVILLMGNKSDELDEYISGLKNISIYINNRQSNFDKKAIFYNDYQMFFDFTKYYINELNIKSVGYIGLGDNDIDTGLKRRTGFEDSIKELQNVDYEIEIIEKNQLNLAEEAIKKIYLKGYKNIICATHTIYKAACNFRLNKNILDLKLTDISSSSGVPLNNDKLIYIDYFYIGLLVGKSIVDNTQIEYKKFKYIFL